MRLKSEDQTTAPVLRSETPYFKKDEIKSRLNLNLIMDEKFVVLPTSQHICELANVKSQENLFQDKKTQHGTPRKNGSSFSNSLQTIGVYMTSHRESILTPGRSSSQY
jgi:hypothetical protein